ncbi:MAG: right-handed parallel beta-helix repeat-containing protein, partial [Candidatus Zixiibacteriota bacterium]
MRFITSFLAAAIIASSAYSATIEVPAQYPTIQAAIDAAVDGDVVLVSPGTYVENIDFSGKAITVVSTDGRDNTFIELAVSLDYPVPDGPVDSSYVQPAITDSDVLAIVTFTNGEDNSSVLDGFTVRSSGWLRGIFCYDAGPTIQNCDITDCRYGGDGAGIWCVNSSARIIGNRIYNNIGSITGGGVGGRGEVTPEIAYNEIYENYAPHGPGIGFVAPSANLNIHHNLIRHNTSQPGCQGALYIYGQNSDIVNNTIVGNSASGITLLDGYSINIINNIVASNDGAGLIPLNASYDYNDIWDNTSNNLISVNGISVDPEFVDPVLSDFRLQPPSPCVDAGHPDPQYNDPDGTRNDMGAFPSELSVLTVTNIGVMSESPSNVVNHTPVIEWYMFEPEGLPQVAFELEIGTDADWSVAEMWATGEVVSPEMSIDYSGLPLEDGVTYYVRVRATNGVEWSDWGNGIFTMNSVPSMPVPQYPIEQTVVRLNYVRLEVLNSEDAEGDALVYDYEVFADAALIELVAGDYGVEEQVSITISARVPGLEADREYWWVARASDGYEQSSWTDPESFLTESGGVIRVPEDQPTIQAALDVSLGGDTVLVSPGVYAEALSYPPHAVTVISSEGAENTVLTAPAVEDMINVPVPDGLLSEDTSAVLTDEVLTLVHAAVPDSGSSFEGFTVTGAHGVQWLVYLETTLHFEIANNRFVDNDAYDVIRCMGNAPITVTRNLIANSATGNAVVTISPRCNFINNTVYGGARGLAIYGEYSVILNNIVTDVDWYAIYDPHYTSTVDYNDFWNNGSNGWPGGNGISLDPLFIDPESDVFYLKAGSPCVDAGHPDPQYNDPDGSRNDMGAYSLFETPVSVCEPQLVSEDQTHVISHEPTIEWLVCGPPTATQVAYQIEVGTDADWSVAEMWATGEVFSSSTSVVYAGLPLDDGQTYYVRIRIYDGTDWSYWSGMQFRMNSFPTSPEPSYPVSQQLIHINQVYLSVLNSTDPEADVLVYDFEIYSDPMLTILVASQSGVTEQENITSSDIMSGLETDQEYWWRARCFDGYEHSEWSTVESFLTRGAATIYVPEEFPTIQDALNNCAPEDTIAVGPGTYQEYIDFLGKDVVLVSSGGRDVTFIAPIVYSSPDDLPTPMDSSSA